MDDQRTDPVVLLVDDDVMERFLHRQALEPAGFEIVEAEDGAAALEAFVITMPDIVVLDLMMPEMDGFAVCKAIRAMPAGRNTPILVATGLDDVESIEGAYRVGATDFIAKPISYSVLPHRLRYMLRAYHLAEVQRISGRASDADPGSPQGPPRRQDRAGPSDHHIRRGCPHSLVARRGARRRGNAEISSRLLSGHHRAKTG